jgi:3-oxoacyl-(acyl-carrier-protein) synthase
MISPLGENVSATLQALYRSDSGLGLLTRFPAPYLFPVGEIPAGLLPDETMPGTHQFALTAAFEAVRGSPSRLKVFIIGVTTGGMH